MPVASGDGVGELVGEDPDEPLLGCAGGVYEDKAHTDRREPPPQNSVWSPLQNDEQLPWRTRGVLMLLPQ